jgi:hypothetical protein
MPALYCIHGRNLNSKDICYKCEEHEVEEFLKWLDSLLHGTLFVGRNAGPAI